MAYIHNALVLGFFIPCRIQACHLGKRVFYKVGTVGWAGYTGTASLEGTSGSVAGLAATWDTSGGEAGPLTPMTWQGDAVFLSQRMLASLVGTELPHPGKLCVGSSQRRAQLRVHVPAKGTQLPWAVWAVKWVTTHQTATFCHIISTPLWDTHVPFSDFPCVFVC